MARLEVGVAAMCVGALLASGCRDPFGEKERKQTAINHLRDIARETAKSRLPPGPLSVHLIGIYPSPEGISRHKIDGVKNGSKYLTFFDPLESEAATAEISFPKRGHFVSKFFAEYPSKDQTLFNLFDNRDFLKDLESSHSPILNPEEAIVGVSVPAGYGPTLLSGVLHCSDKTGEADVSLTDLPAPSETDVDRLPTIDTYSVGGHAIQVSFSRGILSTLIAPNPTQDVNRYLDTHAEYRYTGGFFSTTTPPDFAPGQSLDLVMRLARLRWSDRPGSWFVLNLRDVLDSNAVVTNEYGFSADPGSKKAEFQAILVETHAWTEQIRIPNAGVYGPDESGIRGIRLNPNLIGTAPSGWQLELRPNVKTQVDEVGVGQAEFEGSLVAPSGAITPIQSPEPDPLIDQHFITDIQFTGQATRRNDSLGKPTTHADGIWREGPLGDAIVTVVHLERRTYPTKILRLEIHQLAPLAAFDPDATDRNSKKFKRPKS